MNIPYLLKILQTNKLSELVDNIDLPFLDINLAIDDAIESGQISVNNEKDRVKALVEPEISFDSDLADKLLRTVTNYTKKETNITRGRLTNLVKNQASQFNYPYHEYLMALQYLIDSNQISEEIVSVPKADGRPYHKFVFLQFKDNPNDDWNREVVNKWIADWNKKK